jgi:hypothetical protein
MLVVLLLVVFQILRVVLLVEEVLVVLVLLHQTIGMDHLLEQLEAQV